MALTQNQIPRYAVKPFTAVGVLNAASAGALGSDTNGVTIYTADTNVGSRVDSLVISTDDTAAVNVWIYIKNGSDIKPLGIVNVPLSSGNSGTVANVDALLGSGVTLLGAKVDNNGKRYIDLMPSDVLKCAVLANMTAAKKAYVVAQGADYYSA